MHITKGYKYNVRPDSPAWDASSQSRFPFQAILLELVKANRPLFPPGLFARKHEQMTVEHFFGRHAEFGLIVIGDRIDECARETEISAAVTAAFVWRVMDRLCPC